MLNPINEDLKDLQKQTLNTIISWSWVVLGIAMYWDLFLYTSQLFFEVFMLVATFVFGVSILSSRILFNKNKIDAATLTLVCGSILSLDFALLTENALGSFLPYLFVLIIALSGIIISPEAALYTALGSIISSILFVGFFWGVTLEIFMSLIPSLVLSFLIGVVTWGGATNLTTTLSWVLQSQQKARIRRDELFESREELKKAYALVERSNANLQKAQTKLEERAKELIDLNTKLRTSEKELRLLNASKDKFFSIVAHDLKGPFQPLLGLSQILSKQIRKLEPENAQSMADDIYQSAQNVYKLLDNLLQWSRIQRGKMPHQPDNLNLYKIAAQTVNLLMVNAQNKKITLHNKVPSNIFVYADENMLDTIIRNLTSNALKFTPKDGNITISAKFATTHSSASESESSELVQISVTDTGVGITQEDLNKLFKLEVHHTTQGTENEKGTGLGLIMCQEMVKKNGGQIWIESQIGQGTAVKFTMPLGETKLIEETLLDEENLELNPNLNTIADIASNEIATNETTSNQTDSLTPPPLKELNILLDLALKGNIMAINKRAKMVEAMGEQFVPFASKLRKLALSFEDEEIRNLIERYINVNETN